MDEHHHIHTTNSKRKGKQAGWLAQKKATLNVDHIQILTRNRCTFATFNRKTTEPKTHLYVGGPWRRVCSMDERWTEDGRTDRRTYEWMDIRTSWYVVVLLGSHTYLCIPSKAKQIRDAKTAPITIYI